MLNLFLLHSSPLNHPHLKFSNNMLYLLITAQTTPLLKNLSSLILLMLILFHFILHFLILISVIYNCIKLDCFYHLAFVYLSFKCLLIIILKILEILHTLMNNCFNLIFLAYFHLGLEFKLSKLTNIIFLF